MRRFTDAIMSAVPAADRRTAVLLALAALVLYAPAIRWGLPHATAPDRIYPWGADEVSSIGAIGELYNVYIRREPPYNPQYPLFHLYLQCAFDLPYLLFQWFTGGWRGFASTYPYGFADPVASLAGLTIMNRLPTLLLATGVVVAAFRTGVILRDRRTGLLAALSVLLIYPMFYYSGTGNVDVPALFWMSSAIAVLASAVRGALTNGHAVALGTLIALAGATKDANGLILAPAGLFLTVRSLWRPEERRAVVTMIGVAIAVGTIATGVLVNPERFWKHLTWIIGDPLSVPFRTPATPAGYGTLFLDIVRVIVDSMGLPLAVCALAGLAICAMRDRATLAVASPAAGVLLILMIIRFVFPRYVLPIAFVLALFAAMAISTAIGAAPRRLRSATIGATALVFGWQMVRGADLTYQMMFDSRYELGEWFARNARPGDRVLYYSPPSELPRLDARVVSILGETAEPPSGAGSGPEFVMVGRLLHPGELPENHAAPRELYDRLRDGSLGYRLMYGYRRKSLFSRHALQFVNPPMGVFVRADRTASLRDREPWINVPAEPQNVN